MKKKILISEPFIDKKEINSVANVLKSGWITQGPKVREFENLFSKYHNSKYAVALSSCTTALHLMLLAAGIKKNDEVIIPSFTWVSTANAVLYIGAKPVFVDVNIKNYNIDINLIKKKITKKTKAILLVHLFGLCVDIFNLKRKISKNIIILEDCACAAGSKIGKKYAGTLGLAGAFSFHPRKIISTGEGGMILTNNYSLYKKLIQLRNHGASISEEDRHKSDKPYFMPHFNVLGYNYRMTDLQGAIGIEQTRKLKIISKFQKKWANFYFKELKNIKWLELPVIPKNFTHGWQAFVILVKKNKIKKSRNNILEYLNEHGISCRPGTHAIHTLSYYKKKYKIKETEFLISKMCQDQTIALPLHNGMNEKDFKYIIKIIKNI